MTNYPDRYGWRRIGIALKALEERAENSPRGWYSGMTAWPLLS